MTDESDATGIPPVQIDGPGEPGQLTKNAGLLSYPEICLLINGPKNIKNTPVTNFKKISDLSKRKGNIIIFLYFDYNIIII